MNKNLKLTRPYLGFGLILVLIGIAMLVYGFIHPDRGDWLGGMIIGFFASAFMFSGVWCCFKKEHRRKE